MRMKNIKGYASILVFTLSMMWVIVTVAIAASSTSQGVIATVLGQNDLQLSGVSGVDVTFSISELNTEVTDASTTLNYATNANGRKVTAALNSPLPAGVGLSLEANGPYGTGAQQLSTSPVDILSGISKVSGSSTLTYRAAVSPAVSPQTITRTVTFTLTVM